MITVNNEKELYNAMQKGGETIFLSEGIYNIGAYVTRMKRIMKLSYKKEKSQRKRR